MQKQIEKVKELAAKDFPITSKHMPLLLARIYDELLEAMQTENDNDLREELTDVLIQTIQALIASGADIEAEFDRKMEKNFKRDFSRHFRDK